MRLLLSWSFNSVDDAANTWAIGNMPHGSSSVSVHVGHQTTICSYTTWVVRLRLANPFMHPECSIKRYVTPHPGTGEDRIHNLIDPALWQRLHSDDIRFAFSEAVKMYIESWQST